MPFSQMMPVDAGYDEEVPPFRFSRAASEQTEIDLSNSAGMAAFSFCVCGGRTGGRSNLLVRTGYAASYYHPSFTTIINHTCKFPMDALERVVAITCHMTAT